MLLKDFVKNIVMYSRSIRPNMAAVFNARANGRFAIRKMDSDEKNFMT